MKRNDIILAASIFLFAGFISVVLFLTGNGQGNLVTVTVDKKVYGIYSLDENQEIEIDTGAGRNVLCIENGTVRMTEADCPDGYCKKQGKISGKKETIVCLPHKLIVEIESADEGGDKDFDILVE